MNTSSKPQLQGDPFIDLQAVILAFTEDQELQETVDHELAIGLFPVANQPLISYSLSLLCNARFKEVIIIAGAKQTVAIEEYVAQFKQMSIIVVGIREPTSGIQPGTGDAIAMVRHLLHTDFLVIPIDTIISLDLNTMINEHRISGAMLTMLLLPIQTEKSTRNTNPEQPKCQDAVWAVLSPENTLIALEDIQSLNHGQKLILYKDHLIYHPSCNILLNLRDAGIYLFKHSVLRFWDLPDQSKLSSIKYDVIPLLIALQLSHISKSWAHTRSDCDNLEDIINKMGLSTLKGLSVEPAAPSENAIVMVHIPLEYSSPIRIFNTDDYLEANLFISSQKQTQKTLPKPPTNCTVGNDTVIHGHAILKNSVIGNNCILSSGIKITQSLLLDNVTVESNSVLQHCVVGASAVIKSGAKLINCRIASKHIVEENERHEDTTLPLPAWDT